MDNPLTTLILDGLGIVIFIAGGIFAIFGSRSRQNSTASDELINKLQKLRDADKEEFSGRLKVLEDQHIEDAKTLANLQGQLASYREIPLKDIALSLKSISNDTKANTDASLKILDELKKSAHIIAVDKKALK